MVPFLEKWLQASVSESIVQEKMIIILECVEVNVMTWCLLGLIFMANFSKQVYYMWWIMIRPWSQALGTRTQKWYSQHHDTVPFYTIWLHAAVFEDVLKEKLFIILEHFDMNVMTSSLLGILLVVNFSIQVHYMWWITMRPWSKALGTWSWKSNRQHHDTVELFALISLWKYPQKNVHNSLM